MSLLMDALRRAEKDKRVKAARGRASSQEPVHGEEIDRDALTVEAAQIGSEDVTQQIDPQAVAAATARAAREQPDAPEADDLDFSLADAEAVSEHDSGAFDLAAAAPGASPAAGELSLEPLSPDSAGARSGEEGPRDDSESADQASQSATLGGTTRGAGFRPDETATMPSSRALQSDLNAYFDPSRSMEIPRPAGQPDQTLEDVARHTVVDAQTVFAAGRRPRANRLFLAVAVLAVAVVIGIGVVAIFYARHSPPQRFIPPPTVADGVERQPPRELPVVPQDPPAPLAVEPIPRIDTAAEPAAAPAAMAAAARETAAAAEASAPASAASARVAAAAAPEASAPAAAATPAASSRDTAPGAVDGKPVPPRTALPMPPATPAVDPDEAIADVGVGEVRIARAQHAATGANLMTAYDAYRAGDLGAAEARYRAFLADRPEHRDALLGLAAIAIVRGDLAQAYAHYAKVLARHPDDAVAHAALFNLTGAEGEAGAAQLRLLRDTHPEAAYLSFALGNWYAGQGRWADAQQAYFEAHARDADNPDYVHNLAISLDRMGQGKAALEYYQKALALADAGAVGFNPTPLLERIGELSATTAR
ncbi:MAG: tetratricopeptide repeat protein [Gammaproteobacteria bacterium]